jgi:hypothetical protein
MIPSINNSFIENLSKHKSIVIISGMSMVNYLQNIKYKFQEGMFLNSVEIKSYVELVHGTYQVKILNFRLFLEYGAKEK